MKTIEINKEVLDLVPSEFRNLPADVDYRLTKTESFRDGYVYEGDTVVGPLSIVNVLGKPGVKVLSNNPTRDITYLRTSPIVEVVDVTDTTITFKTEGGVYKLERT
jgi:hypothetical protein